MSCTAQKIHIFENIWLTWQHGQPELDNFDDIVIGSPGFSTASMYNRGRVFVLIGSSDPKRFKRSIILSNPSETSRNFGYNVKWLDVDNDGRDDLIVRVDYPRIFILIPGFLLDPYYSQCAIWQWWWRNIHLYRKRWKWSLFWTIAENQTPGKRRLVWIFCPNGKKLANCWIAIFGSSWDVSTEASNWSKTYNKLATVYSDTVWDDNYQAMVSKVY